MGNVKSSRSDGYQLLPTETKPYRPLPRETTEKTRALAKLIADEVIKVINFSYLDFYYWTSPETTYNTSAARQGIVAYVDDWLQANWGPLLTGLCLHVERTGSMTAPIKKGLEAGFIDKSRLRHGMTVFKIVLGVDDKNLTVYTKASRKSSSKLMAHYAWDDDRLTFEKIYPIAP